MEIKKSTCFFCAKIQKKEVFFISKVPPELVEEIKKMDLLTYFQNYEPQELVRVGNGTYTTKTHDSLRMSNGLWNWFSRKIGGRSAIDYIKEEKGLKFIDAVEYIADKMNYHRPFIYENDYKKEEKIFELPQKELNNNRAKSYLIKRGIDKEIVQKCIENNLIYEEKDNHNVVFVGYDKNKNAKYAFCRATNESRYMRDAKGSDKKYTFRFNSINKCNRVHLFESAIDLLSYATLMKMKNLNWQNENMISLAGVSKPSVITENTKIPITIKTFLDENPNINEIHLHLDNDEVGREASIFLQNILSKKYKVVDRPAPIGKDCNDYLRLVLGYRNFNKNTNEKITQKVRVR